MSMELGKLGMVDKGGGTWQYFKSRNPLLMQGVIGVNNDGSEVLMSADTFIRKDVADAIAALPGVNGEVIQDPDSGGFNLKDGAVMWAIRANGVTVNGGAIGMVMGNDSYKANQRAKAVYISELLAIDPPDEHLADKIWDATVGAGIVKAHS